MDDREVLLLFQIFGQSENQLQRIVDVVRDTGRKRAQSGQFVGLEQFSFQFRLVLNEFPEQSGGGSAEDLGAGTLHGVDERFHGWVAGHIHDQIDAMIPDEILHPFRDQHIQISRPLESGSRRILVRNADDLHVRDLMKEIQDRGSAFSGADDGNSRRTKFHSRFP